MASFNIIDYIGTFSGFDFPKNVLERIALDREVNEVTSASEITQKQKDLIKADMLYYIYTSPTSTASRSWSHGTFSKSVGSQTTTDKRNIYNLMMSLYKKHDDPNYDSISESEGNVEWIDENEYYVGYGCNRRFW